MRYLEVITTSCFIVNDTDHHRRYNLCDGKRMGWFMEDSVSDMLTKYINKTCDNHALIMLALCYLPGVLAAYTQLVRGTKYSQFPAWLDTWLRQ